MYLEKHSIYTVPFPERAANPFCLVLFLSLENGNRQKVMETCTEIKLRSSLDIFNMVSLQLLFCPRKQLCEYTVDIRPCVYVI